MIYCYRCGVQLEDQAQACPLCHTQVPDGARDNPKPPKIPESSWAPGFPSLAESLVVPGPKAIPRGKDLRLFISLVFLSPLLPMGLIWFIQEPGMPWILWAGGILLGLWLILVPLGRLSRRPLPYSLVLLVVSAGILVAIDWTIGPVDWSLEIALPTSGLIILGYLFLRALSKKFSDLGLPFMGGIILSLSLIISITDGLINLYFGEPFWGTWAFFMVIGVPFASALFFLHYRMGWRVDGKKFFDL